MLPSNRSISSMFRVAILMALSASIGCTGRPAEVDSEKEALNILTSEFDAAVLESDDKGRVVHLKLEGPQVTDAAIDQLVHFKMLKHVSLRDASVTDAAMQKLRENKRLSALGITGTRVTDKGLKSLTEVASLRYVWVLVNDRLTETGVDGLKKSLPGVTIYVMNKKKPAPKTKTE
jgi:hypothetical protein